MPRQAGVTITNKFVRGLVTEATALSFPEDAATETSDCVFDYTGKVTRRKGFDTEANYTTDSVSLSAGEAYTSYIWDAVSGDGTTSFLVVQSGKNLQFYDISTETDISTNKLSHEIDIESSFLAEGSNKNPAIHLCQFTSGNGDLFVVNEACDPFYVSYSITEESFTETAIELKYRDFIGLDDGLDVDERPTASVSGIETSNPNHLYNLHNQGWLGTDALSQWDTDRSDLPSNADYIALFRNSNEDAYAPNAVGANDPGNRPAPKGHFILTVGEDDRQQAVTDAGETYVVETETTSLIDRTTGSIIGDFSDQSVAFDGNLEQTSEEAASKSSSTTAYIGKNYGSSDTKTVNRVVIYPSTNKGFLDSNNFNLDMTLYGNNSAPANGTDGTSLGTATTLTTDQTTSVTIESTDATTEYQYLWVYFSWDSSDTLLISEVQFYSGLGSFEKPSSVEFYAGRVFYGGIQDEGVSNNLYFSQIIEDEEQYGLCYQKNDPTSEDFPDLLANDGGVIKIPEMGTLQKLYSYQNALLVFANNGVWLIQGASGAGFKATDYVVKRISSIGMNSPESLISIKGLPAWWGEDGIYTVEFDANYDSFTPVSLSLQTIDTFYREIPLMNRKYVKGAYDEIEQIAYWIYSDDSDLSSDVYRYDSVLCLDARTKAFYPWDISAGPIVRTLNYVKSADRQAEAKLKFMIHQNYTGSAADQTFAEVTNTNYIDWEEEGTNSDYCSYFVTGYRLDGQTQRFFQPNYVFVFLDQETNASCFMQAIFDFTTSANTGKWSRKQQVYNENLTNRGTNFRRLKVRGKGRALQLRFESEEQMPFSIIGWSIWETSNAGL